MKPLYRPVVKEAWRVCRSSLFLWPLAFLASLVGIFSTFQVFFDISEGGDLFTVNNWFTDGDFISSTFIGWSTSLNQIPWSSVQFADAPLLLFFFALLFIVLALAVLITSSEGGLMYALGQLQQRKKTTYLQSLRVGLDKFWQLFGINLIYRLLYLTVVAVLIIPLMYQIALAEGSAQMPLAILVYFIIIPLVIVIDLVTRYSLMYVMLYQQTIKQAFLNAWLLFRTNWITSIETSLLILLTLFVAFSVLSVVFLPLLMLLLALFASFLSTTGIALQLFLLITLVIMIAIVAAFVSFFTAFQMSIWVSIFNRLTTGEHHSKIHRLAGHFPILHRKII